MSSATRPSDNVDRAISAFLGVVRDDSTRQKLQALADRAKTKCEKILDSIHIKAIVTNRIKKYDSLEKKIYEMVKGEDSEFRKWIEDGKNIKNHPEMGDLAGVRIGLYFPDDVVKIQQEIEKHFDVKHYFGTVTGGRDANTGERNVDVINHGRGPWMSKDRDGNLEYWEHSGYKSWQVVVAWKNGGPEVNGLGRRPRVEIQIGTVVTQAWAEIQHNIIYKQPDDILATPTMRRMIDAVNGLAITTEIMLRELDRSVEIAKNEAAARPFSNTYHFEDWFKATYLDRMSFEERQRWVQPRLGHLLCGFQCTKLRHNNSLLMLNIRDPAHEIRCVPGVYKRLIQNRGLMQGHDGPYDISVLILQECGYVFDERKSDPVAWYQPDHETLRLLQGTDDDGAGGTGEQFIQGREWYNTDMLGFAPSQDPTMW